MYTKIVFLWMFFLCANCTGESSQGLWVVRDMLKSKESIDSVVSYATVNNIDILFVQVRGRGSVYYNSMYEDLEENQLNFDPLDYLLSKTKNTSINVHAWFNLYLIWSKSEAPASLKHPLNKFQHAILKDYNFESFDQFNNNGQKKLNIEGYYLSPFHSEVNEYLTNMLKELIVKYPLQGIHFDYIRYPNSNFINDQNLIDYISNKYGFSPLLLKRYPDSAASMYSKNDYLENMEKIREIYSRPISEFVKNIYGWINDNFPELMVSAAVKPDPILAKTRFYQDWVSWINNNYIDFVVIMNYSNATEIFKKNLEKIIPIVDCSRVMVGIAAYNKNINAIQHQINIAKNLNFGSFSLFSYKHVIKMNTKKLLKKK